MFNKQKSQVLIKSLSWCDSDSSKKQQQQQNSKSKFL